MSQRHLLRLLEDPADPLPGQLRNPAGSLPELELAELDLSAEPVDYDRLLVGILGADAVQVW